MANGILVVVEGVNGAGKSSIIDLVVKHFDACDKSIIVYKFPNRKGKFGSRIDRYLKGQLTISSKYDILHMFAANRMAVRESMENDLLDGSIVICDRYIFSAIAYHIPSHVKDKKKISMYCSIIGHFDQSMPIPNMVYLIEGEHLAKRKNTLREIFHHSGNESTRLKNMIYNVISHFSTRFRILTNTTDHMADVANYIIDDIETML